MGNLGQVASKRNRKQKNSGGGFEKIIRIAIKIVVQRY